MSTAPVPAAATAAEAVTAAPDASVTLPLLSAAANGDLAPPALQVKLLSPRGRAPTRGSAFAAGYDLYAAQTAVVPARGKVVVDTDISIAVPAGTCESAPTLIDLGTGGQRED